MQDVDRDAKESPSLWDHWQRNNVLLLLAGWVCLGGSVWAGVSGRECLGGSVWAGGCVCQHHKITKGWLVLGYFRKVPFGKMILFDPGFGPLAKDLKFS